MYPPMSTRRTTKKTPLKDWHPADIKAALEKAGWSLRRLSLHHGYKPTTLKEALHRRYPKAERLIADAIGVDPDTIWPSRYTQHSASRAGASHGLRQRKRVA